MVRARFGVTLLALAACGGSGSAVTADADDAVAGDAALGTPTLAITPTNLAFGAVRITTVSAPITLTVTNIGTAASPPLISTISGPGANAFQLLSTTCTGVLAAGATCAAQVTFSPQVSGTTSSQLSIAGGATTVTATLSGIGATAGLSISPSVHNFGALPVNTVSAMTLTLTNAGSAPTGALIVMLDGANSADFTIRSPTCAGASVAAGATCTMTVALRPSAPGARAADLHVTAPAGGGAVTASVLGSGLATTNLSLAPTLHDFGNVQIDSNSLGFQFTVTNGSAASTGTFTTTKVGSNIGDFQVMANQCGAALAPGGACTFFVVFEPGAVGPRSAHVVLTASPGGSVDADVRGTCTP
ncbi:hypothetical protein BH11MYX3_BH11MYX3_23610 [soil metagenome]